MSPSYNGPARYAAPSEAQAEVVLALDDVRATHVVQIAEIVGVSVGAIRKRLGALEHKRLVVAAPGGLFRNEWILTGAGRVYRERLAVEATR